MAKIYISPSTQEHNVGVAGYGTEEKEMNLIADYTVSALKRAGQTVFRNLPTMMLAQAVADSNAKKVDLHFAIHSNAGGARGCEVFETSDRGKKLADSVYKYLSSLTPVADRGVKPTEHLYELNKTNAPAALAEVSFHDNAEDSIWIQANRKNIGEAIAKGILEYLGVKYVPEPIPQPVVKSAAKLYKVQVGAFGEKPNADKLVTELKSKGYNAYIVEVLK